MSIFENKIAAVILAVLTALCAFFAGVHVLDEIWGQWSNPDRGGMCHAAACLIPPAIALVNFILLVIGGIGWLRNARNVFFPHRMFAALSALLLASAISYVPSHRQYAVAAVLLLGPGPQSVKLQQGAALSDSTRLLDALIKRGAVIEKNLLAFAAYNDSPSVVARLIEYGAQVNEQHYPNKITALHQAVRGKQYRTAEILVRAGARADIPNVSGVTPLDLAVRQGDERMLSILKH